MKRIKYKKLILLILAVLSIPLFWSLNVYAQTIVPVNKNFIINIDNQLPMTMYGLGSHNLTDRELDEMRLYQYRTDELYFITYNDVDFRVEYEWSDFGDREEGWLMILTSGSQSYEYVFELFYGGWAKLYADEPLGSYYMTANYTIDLEDTSLNEETFEFDFDIQPIIHHINSYREYNSSNNYYNFHINNFINYNDIVSFTNYLYDWLDEGDLPILLTNYIDQSSTGIYIPMYSYFVSTEHITSSDYVKSSTQEIIVPIFDNSKFGDYRTFKIYRDSGINTTLVTSRMDLIIKLTMYYDDINNTIDVLVNQHYRYLDIVTGINRIVNINSYYIDNESNVEGNNSRISYISYYMTDSETQYQLGFIEGRQQGMNEGMTYAKQQGFDEARAIYGIISNNILYTASQWGVMEYKRGVSVGQSASNQASYDRGFDDGTDYGASLGETDAFNRGYDKGSNESFMANIDKWIVPAIIVVLFGGGFLYFASRRRE